MIFDETLRLGQCSSKSDALFKARAWAKKRHKSFSVLKIERYNYSVVTHRKNYFTITVEYFTSKKGKYPTTP